jgi:hypothetical protein
MFPLVSSVDAIPWGPFTISGIVAALMKEGRFWGDTDRNPKPGGCAYPLPAFFGTKDDVGGEAEPNLLKSSIRRQSSDCRLSQIFNLNLCKKVNRRSFCA